MHRSISHRLSLEMVKRHWIKLQSKLAKHPSLQCILDLMDFSLKNNISEFNDKLYRLLSGLTQGGNFSAQ